MILIVQTENQDVVIEQMKKVDVVHYLVDHQAVVLIIQSHHFYQMKVLYLTMKKMSHGINLLGLQDVVF